jgi:SAM-dependent methyltransferase
VTINADDFEALQQPAIRDALRTHAALQGDAFMLRFGSTAGWPSRAMAEQLRCRHKARAKLPDWPIDELLFTLQAIEQCSSLATARFKASLVNGRILDLCCGLAVDAIAMAQAGCSVTAHELDTDLARLVRHNAAKLTVDLTLLERDSMQALTDYHAEAFDWIYADPDRRAGGRTRDQRALSLAECSPQLDTHLEALARVAPRMLIKLPPGLDLASLQREMPSCQRVLFISHGGECREALAVCDHHAAARHHAVTEAVILNDDGSVRYALADDRRPVPSAVPPAAWLYEPDPALLRAHALAALANAHGLHPLHPDVSVLTAAQRAPDFPGRVSRVIDHGRYEPKRLRKHLKQLGITTAQIARRHFPYPPDTIAKQLRIGSSGSRRLLCYRDCDDTLCYVLCVPE